MPYKADVPSLQPRKSIISGLNGVVVARHGPILNHSEATGSRKLSRYLPDLREAIFDQKNQKMCKNIENPIFTVNFRIFLYVCLGSLAGVILQATYQQATYE